MTDVKKRRTFSENELPEYKGDPYYTRFYFSQDEEYLIMAISNEVLIIRIGSLSEFFSGSPIDVKAVLQLKKLTP
jgi:hypothetical protein